MKDFLSKQHIYIIEKVLSKNFPSLFICVNGTYEPIHFRYIIYVNVKDIFATFTPNYYTIPIFVDDTMEFNIGTVNKIIEEATKGIETMRGREQ